MKDKRGAPGELNSFSRRAHGGGATGDSRKYAQLPSFLDRTDFFIGFCAICVLIIGGMGLTYQAPWIEWDASDFINVAENIHDGKGIVSGWESDNIKAYWPLTVWPPLYPLLISLFLPLGIPSLTAAAWIPLLSFMGLIIVVTAYGRELGQPLIGYLAGVCCLVFTPFWEVSRMALSDMPYLFLAMLGLYLISRYIRTDQDSILILSGVVCGLAGVTRYLGATLAVTGAFIILVYGHRSFARRMSRVVIFTFLSAIPVLLLVVRNITSTGHISGIDRGTGSGMTLDLLFTISNVCMSDLNPNCLVQVEDLTRSYGSVCLLLLLVILVAMMYGLTVSLQDSFRISIRRFFRENAIFPAHIIIYLVTLLVFRVVWKDIAPIQTRYLLPIYPCLILFLISVAWFVFIQSRIFWIRNLNAGFIGVLLLVFIIGQAVDTASLNADKGGRFYTDPIWYDNPVEEYQWLSGNLTPGIEVISNNPRPLQLYLNRLIIPLPKRSDPTYAMKQLMLLKPGYLIVSLQGKKANEEFLNGEELLGYNRKFSHPATYQILFKNHDATIYQITGSAS